MATSTHRASPRFRFVNADGSEPQRLSAVFKWLVVDNLRGERRSTPATAAVPTVAPDVAALATPPAPGEGARLTWIGHASWLVQLDGVSLLIDPVFSRSLGPRRRNVPPALLPAQLPAIDAQLVSHSHRDHLDMPSLRAVGRPVLAGEGLAGLFASKGLACTELDWWSEARVGAVRVVFVPSQHWSQRGLTDKNETLWGGFVIEGSSARVYHSGDTAYFDGFAAIGRRAGPIDAAMLPIGAYDPEWFMRKQHMNPADATQAFVDLGAREFLAMHWGTFKLTDEALDDPPKVLDAEWARRGLDPARKHVLPIGGSFAVRAT
ncbi:MAG TPA: MBL fold metallo-hydrolase [Polyangiaceae bacterium]|jgi:L-ascorbate metabolism protein UlaG (beta-lactamase superfamily)|nr:MBL fold metallo-hydrolase [Polyangiaceae bacterium]